MADANPNAPTTPFNLPSPEQLNIPDDEEAGADSLAQQPQDLGSTIAQHQIAAGQINHGDSRDWAENAVAGVQSALAGFGAAGKVPAGAGALYGVGAAAREGQANRQEQQKEQVAQQQRQQQIDLEKQRVTDEESHFDQEQKLRLAENARQQAQATREMVEHDKRMVQFDDAHTAFNFEQMDREVTFRQNQLDREELLQSQGAKPMEVGGQQVPGFADLGQLEDYANKTGLAKQAHTNGYRTRPIFGGDGQYHLYEIPDTGPQWVNVKDADGKPTRIFGDPLSVANYQDKVAQVREANARTNLTYSELKKQDEGKVEEGTVKAARAELTKAGGDYSKLSAGSKDALRVNAQKQYQSDMGMYQAAMRDMQKDPEYFDTQSGGPDAKGKLDELRDKYHVNEASEQLAASYDALRNLGVGYRPPGATPPPAAAPAIDPNSPEGAVAAQQQQDNQAAAAQTAKDERDQTLAKIGEATMRKTGTATRNGMTANPAYNEKLDRLLKAHPDWTDDEKIRAYNKLVGAPTAGGGPSGPKPLRAGQPITAKDFSPFLQAAGGDLQKAKAAAQAAGWGDPQ